MIPANVDTDFKSDSSNSNNFDQNKDEIQRISTLVIGGGQSGLAVGYYLKKHNIPFLILDANKRVGDAWRSRWDSLRLFTPASYDGLPGRRYPAPPHYFPTKDEMGDFLEHYANEFKLPVMNDVRVDSLKNEDGKFIVCSGTKRFEADRVIIAMASYQEPKVPDFADTLEPGITQFHSGFYKKPNQLKEGDVLLVGAGNSASEIAMELSRTHKVYLSGRDTGAVPFRINTTIANYILIPLVLKFLFHRVFTIDTFIGRKIRKRVLTTGGPLIRVKPRDLKKAGIIRVPRTAGTRNGKPLLEDGQTLDVRNVIWCTGFHPGFSWIDIPVMGDHEPKHRAGIVESVPGLYFTGLHFLYALSSTMVQGVGRDAKRIVNHISGQMKFRMRA